MSLKTKSYRILLVSSNQTFTTSFTNLLSSTRYQLAFTASNISVAKRAIAEHNFDFVIINSPLPDESGIEFAIDISTTKQTVVLLLIRNEIHMRVHSKVIDYGVFTLAKPISKATLNFALSWMESARERLRLSEKKSQSIQEKMTEIRLVNRAKWILISELKMTEPHAHHYIEKQAMDRCVSKRKIAEDIIKTYQ